MIRIGIIGAGSLSSRHINAYLKDGRCEIAAIADINPDYKFYIRRYPYVPAWDLNLFAVRQKSI